MSFDITVLGSSGGPLEGITCSYILKPSYITYKDIIQDELKQYLIAIDAGSGLNRITEIISTERTKEKDTLAMKVLNYYNDPLPIDQYTHPNISFSHEYGVCKLNKDSAPIELSFRILDLINNFLISHPHLDHINGLVINSPGFHYHSSKSVYGLKETTEALQNYIFNDIIWPNLVTEQNGSFLKLIEMEPTKPMNIDDIYEVTPFELNHGKKHDNKSEYKSTSFLIKDSKTDQYILIFGDVEADRNAQSSKNKLIWEKISDLIIRRDLKTILIECSTPNLPAKEPRFGHMTPDSLIEELCTLGELISSKKSRYDVEPPLKDLNILITHVKERRSGHEPRRVILNELNELNERYKLGCHFSVMLTGLTYTV